MKPYPNTPLSARTHSILYTPARVIVDSHRKRLCNPQDRMGALWIGQRAFCEKTPTLTLPRKCAGEGTK